NCYFCNQFSRENVLESSFITPTYIKNFESLHYRRIWRIAFDELAEADEIIFIGYSFPEADYELRYLLKKAINKDTNIKVVLHETDDPNYYDNKIKSKYTSLIKNKINLPEIRYSSFFNKNKLEFDYNGIDGFFKNGRRVK
ncbi:MAG: hypothetical protein ACOC1K_03960, partial [Nanoarchaeota archaeon]